MEPADQTARAEKKANPNGKAAGKRGWTMVCDGLRKSVGNDAFQRWFGAAKWIACEDGVASISVPGEIHQVWIETNYLPELTLAVGAAFEDIREVVVLVDSEGKSPTGGNGAQANAAKQSRKAAALEGEALDKRIKLAGLNPGFSFESFVVGANSQFAHAACEAVAKKSGISYNPLFIHGGPGLGKTHLMQAIGQEILRRNPSSRVIYLTCEKFTNEFIDAVRRGDIEKFRRRYRSSDVLLIDDVQFLVGKERSQEEFFHTFNTLLDGRNQVVITCDRPACEIKNMEPRLVSRFECGLTVEMQPPQIETRMAILKKKTADWKVRVDEVVLEFLAEKIRTNVRRLEGALMRVATYASLAGERVTVDKVEHLLRDLIHEEASRQVTIDSIQKAVAEHFDVRLADMTSRRRPASIAFPRQIAMYLSRALTKGSLVEIGEAFGGRDHGTVIHACKKVHEMIDHEAGLKETIARIESHLRR
ncbi:chromosomal replication initiator protein DnaA [Luteolibacter pohnpeiensis]|uniref:Chromosomal replication initiator protein DnaA n=1 Tax=Luteolibacter pohnpeiensis TaxID=454153 RepID=A0A934VWW9_9BACT|nr:chromosomal replication initiator protein DnaA [Luteolibacter pohnpeiensis]MBK1883715.1 chromosomal replication initiator protein DnaA [Luteolibacter pohnpeiensis]